MSDTILELRQADAVKNTANGDYVCDLAKEITINEGDTVLLKQAFIDSRASAQNVINITEDLILTLENGMYMTDWVDDASKTYNSSTDIYPNHTGNVANGEDYIMCQYLDEPLIPGHIFDNFLITPMTFTTKIVLPKGNYAASDLALYISEQLSIYNNDLAKTPQPKYYIKSNMLKNIFDDELRNGGFYVVFLNSSLTQKFTCASSDIMKDPNYFVGSNEISMSFNESTSKFQWDYMHMPVYSNAGDICVRFIEIPDLDTPTVAPFTKAVSKNSGIFWTALSATTAADINTPVDFWEGILGFDLTKLLPTLGPPVYLPFGDEPTNDTPLNQYQNYTLINGQHTTTGYIGLDAAVSKIQTTLPGPGLPNIPPFCVSAAVPVDFTQPVVKNNGFQSTISNTTAIIATNNVSYLTDVFSHYILDLKMNLYNKVIGNNIYGSISGIISRYYGYGSYTYGQSDGSITYVHKGAPVVIKSIGVRILDADKQLDQTVGPDNSIYMQIIRGTSS